MKVVILAGGYGTRLSEETETIPKPMVRIGPFPILFHIMQIYMRYGFNDFIICCGYKGDLIKEYFNNFLIKNNSVFFDFKSPNFKSSSYSILNKKNINNFTVTCVDTGEKTMTGGRIKVIKKYLNPNEPFFLTYGDGLADIDVMKLLEFHKRTKKIATVTAVSPPGRFGVMDIKNGYVKAFREKLVSDQHKINGGFFVLNYDVMKYLKNNKTIFEQGPLIQLANDGQLAAYEHSGFWHPMDTLRDKIFLNNLYENKKRPWEKKK